MIRVGVIGFGYWGPNIVRNFARQEGATLVSICDKDSNRRSMARSAYPGVKVVEDPKDITTSSEIDMVAVVSPVSTHFALAREALEHGKHVFVEKPMTTTVDEGKRLVQLADEKNLLIMVDHTFLFTGAVRRIKSMVSEQSLGNLYYYDSTRVNLGLFQHDVNVVWDLAPHDLSIMDYVIDEAPVALTAHGMDHFGTGLEDMAFITLYFNSNLIVHLNVNWLSPVKIRQTLIGGEKRMLVWNDLASDEKIKVYDKGVEVATKSGEYELLVSYRSGDMWSPRLEQTEALDLEIRYFLECVQKGEQPFNDGASGLRIVELLTASTESLGAEGRLVEV